jgi:protoporphyrinogen oxidase
MIYDIIIVGGGIAGLNILYELYKKQSRCKILLIEKNNYLGGRIKTFRINLNDHNYVFEEGAGRFNNNHELLIKLINELDLQKYIIKINSESEFKPSSNKISKIFIGKNPYDFINLVLQHLENQDKDISKQFTFQEYALNFNILTNEEFNFVLGSYGYYSELVNMNAYNAYILFKKGINNTLQYYGLSCGLDKIIEEIKNKIINLDIQIKMETEIQNIEFQNEIFKIESNNKQLYYGKKIILAIPRYYLKKLNILHDIKPLLNSITCKPLCRIFYIFNKDDIWFKNIKKVTTNNYLRYIIPIDKENGLIMISYTDNIYAEYWKNKKFEFYKIKKLIYKTFNIDINEPIFKKKSYWNCGIGYWKKNYDSNIISKQILKPLNIPLYICGENYSENQGWIEGALITSMQIIDMII